MSDSNMLAAKPLLVAQDLRKTFVDNDFETAVLKGVTFTLDRGEMVALLGPSGSGKSTLLTILGTLMRPTSGSLAMLGADLTRYDQAALSEFRNRKIGFIFQYHHLLPRLRTSCSRTPDVSAAKPSSRANVRRCC
jgi:lipoprotein-releasing system ATP-binding protein